MYTPSISLKLSSLLLLSQLINTSHQFEQCLVTLKNVRVERDYSFSLAQVANVDDPLGPQEACYYSCGAQLLTQSPDINDMTQLTLLDKSANFLTSTGFLRTGHAYFVNHLGFADIQGANGLGCVEIESPQKFNHYPLSHPVCKQASNALCGFWGKQEIPLGPMNREGKQIKNPNASIIEVKTPEPAPEPEPKPEPENHGWEGGNRGWGGGWNGNHQWNEAEGDGQFNLDGQDDPLYVNPVPILLDSVVTLPVVKYEQVNGEMVEVTKYATFVQLDDDPRVEQDGHKTGQDPQPTRSAGYEGIIDEDYELGVPSIDIDISHASLADMVHHEKEIDENAAPLNHLPFDSVPLNDHNALASNLASLVQEEDAASSNIINFEAFDDLGEIIGEDPFVNALHGDVESIVMEEMSHTEIVSVADTVVEDEVREIPVMVMNLNNATNVDLNVMGKTYRVIPQFSEKTIEQAKALCIKNGASMMSSVQSADYSELTMKLKEAELENIVIGSWNGNDYLASGSHCLVMQVGMGVFPSECVSASAVMCQK